MDMENSDGQYKNRLEQLSKQVIGYSASGGGDDVQQITEMEMELVINFIEAVRVGAFKAIDSDIVWKGIDKAYDGLAGQARKVDSMIDAWKGDLNKVDLQEQQHMDENRKISMKRNELSTELRETGFFDFSRKRELKAEIAGLQPLPAPYDFDARRSEIKSNIAKAENFIHPIKDKLKGLVNKKMDAELHFKQINGVKDISQNISQNMSETFRRAPRMAR